MTQKSRVVFTTIMFQGFQIPVTIWPLGRISFSYMVNREHEMWFTRSHTTDEKGDGWVPISASIPSCCNPRECLPSGIITTIEEYGMIYLKDHKVLGVIQK